MTESSLSHLTAMNCIDWPIKIMRSSRFDASLSFFGSRHVSARSRPSRPGSINVFGSVGWAGISKRATSYHSAVASAAAAVRADPVAGKPSLRGILV
jgi:hypothetical protein